MERFWTLKYLQQQGITELEATVIKDLPNGALVRAETLPLVFPVAGQQERGARLRVKLGEIDEIALDVSGTVLERLDTPKADAAPPKTAVRTKKKWLRPDRHCRRPERQRGRARKYACMNFGASSGEMRPLEEFRE
jgi:hypothetical protein